MEWPVRQNQPSGQYVRTKLWSRRTFGQFGLDLLTLASLVLICWPFGQFYLARVHQDRDALAFRVCLVPFNRIPPASFTLKIIGKKDLGILPEVHLPVQLRQEELATIAAGVGSMVVAGGSSSMFVIEARVV